MTLRGARRPNKPKDLASGSLSKRMSETVTHGVRAARPMTTAVVPAKLTIKLRVGTIRIPPPIIVTTTPDPATRFTTDCTLLSNPARESARRGGTDAASQAGGAAANMLENKPAKAPLIRLDVGIWIPRTLTTK